MSVIARMKLGVHNYLIFMFVESCTVNYDTMVTVLSLFKRLAVFFVSRQIIKHCVQRERQMVSDSMQLDLFDDCC